MEIRCADHATPSTRKMLVLTSSPTSGGRSVDIVRLRTTATEFITLQWNGNESSDSIKSLKFTDRCHHYHYLNKEPVL
jgi:hypothetical protein